MTAYSEIDPFEMIGKAAAKSKATSNKKPNDGFQVDDTYWGYIVRSTEGASKFLIVLQTMAWLIGVGFVVAALGLWLMPSVIGSNDVLGMKIGATVIAIAIASFCLWFASRGTDMEIHIDTRLGEVREVVRNRTGRSSMLNRYGFDAIGSVFIDLGGRRNREDNDMMVDLVLRYRNTSQVLYVAHGSKGNLSVLRDRMGRDLMLTPADLTRNPVPKPEFVPSIA